MFTFANDDQRPLDRDTDRLLAVSAWLGRNPFVFAFTVNRSWRLCQLGRRLFYVGLAWGGLAILCGFLAARSA